MDALARLQAGTLSAATGPTVAEATTEFLSGIKSGAVCQRGGYRYKPSTVRGYERDLRKRVIPTFGAVRLRQLARADVQRWADGLAAEREASTVRNVVASLRALVGWAETLGYVHVNPCAGLRLPAADSKRDVTVMRSSRLDAARRHNGVANSAALLDEPRERPQRDNRCEATRHGSHWSYVRRQSNGAPAPAADRVPSRDEGNPLRANPFTLDTRGQ